MKMKIATGLLFLMIALQAAAQENKQKKSEELQILTSSVCSMCKETLEKTMAFEKGVKKSKLDLPSQVITVVYNPAKTNPDKIRKAIAQAGYDADGLPADPKAYERLNPCCRKEMGIH